MKGRKTTSEVKTFIWRGSVSYTTKHTFGNRFQEYGYVVVNFLSQVIFVSLLFLGMVMYANEIETKEK